MDVGQRGSRGRLHGVAAARRQRAVHDGHGDEDAIRRPRLTEDTDTGGAPRDHRARRSRCGRSATALAAPPCVALLSGEAGIGKTRLVAEVEAAADGWLVLHGESVEFGGEELAYAPVVAALRDLPADWLEAYLDELSSEARGALAAVLPRETPRGGGPGRLFELLLDLLGGSSGRCCSCSRTSTGPTARRSRCWRSWRATCAPSGSSCSPPTASTTSCRPSCAGSRASCGGGGPCVSIELSPLGRDDVARQLEAIAGAPRAGRAGGRAARAGGRQPVLRRRAVRGRRRGSEVAGRAGDRRRGGRSRASSGSTAPRSRCSPPPAGARPTRCSNGSTSTRRAARGARRRRARARARRVASGTG